MVGGESQEQRLAVQGAQVQPGMLAQHRQAQQAKVQASFGEIGELLLGGLLGQFQADAALRREVAAQRRLQAAHQRHRAGVPQAQQAMAAFADLASQAPGGLQVAEQALRAWQEGATGRRQLDLARTAAEQWVPMLSSSSRTCRLSADWATNRRSAARLKPPDSTISTK